MTPEMRQQIKQRIDEEKRRRLFTTSRAGRTILKKQFLELPNTVYGINHGLAWSYRGLGCRCRSCSAAHAHEQKQQRRKREHHDD